jgi:peptidoglycan/LPS O-acetylase OafA/YrhL
MAETTGRSAIEFATPLQERASTAPQRDFYIDRLRSVMTAMVLLHHTAITYGAPGGWFWYELHPSGSSSSLLLTLFVSTNQAYFMGFFFLLAGYFTPSSLERKGYARFIGDRFVRLGLPLLVFILILAPLTVGIANVGDGGGFWAAVQFLWIHKRIINGPLWFAQALLMFSLGYCVWRAAAGRPLTDAGRQQRQVPGVGWWLLSAIAVGAAALAIRLVVPVGVNVFGLQLGYFASYTFLFAIGVCAWRFDWLRQLRWKHARAFIVGLAITWPAMPIGIAVARSLNGPGRTNFAGGLSWAAILYAFWEPFVAWGLIAAWLLVFRAAMNRPSRFWSWLNRRAYAVYILHPPILVGLGILLHSWSAPALVKFTATGTLTCVATWLVADLAVRLPGAQRVL